MGGFNSRWVYRALTAIGSDEQVIVGLGNAGAAYVGTPHNIGYDVVDQLTASMGFAWDKTSIALIARGSWQGQPVWFVKIPIPMNLTGAGLKRAAENMSFSPEQCILVYDDLDMQLGSVRTRLSGGAGGHRGVASILEAFQTDAFRRVKVGVGLDGAKLNRVDYVLTAFDAASRAAVDLAISTAEAHVLKMAASHPKAP